MKTMRKTTELYKQRTIISVVCLSCIYIYFVLSKYVCAFVSVCFVLHSILWRINVLNIIGLMTLTTIDMTISKAITRN